MRNEVTILNSLKERIGAFLENTGTTKQSLANQLGISTQTLRNKLSGKSDFSLTEGICLSKILGCTVEDLRHSASDRAVFITNQSYHATKK